MSLDRFPELSPPAGSLETAELAVTDDVLVKLFALGPGAEIEPHEHAESTNVFHVVAGEVVVVQADTEETVSAPGVVVNDRGTLHGARNESEAVALVTASLCPCP